MKNIIDNVAMSELSTDGETASREAVLLHLYADRWQAGQSIMSASDALHETKSVESAVGKLAGDIDGRAVSSVQLQEIGQSALGSYLAIEAARKDVSMAYAHKEEVDRSIYEFAAENLVGKIITVENVSPESKGIRIDLGPGITILPKKAKGIMAIASTIRAAKDSNDFQEFFLSPTGLGRLWGVPYRIRPFDEDGIQQVALTIE
jgi:hypothetical protein